MRHIEFKFEPQEVKIRAEEILADLNYPAPAVTINRTRTDDRTRRKARS